jgi:hypothetical protein
MKNAAIIILAVLALAGITSCQKAKDAVNKATEFDMSYSTQFSIPSTSITVTQPVDFTTPNIPTQSSSRFISEQTTQDLIDEIKMTKFVVSNPNGNLNYLKSLSIYLKTSNLGDVLVATESNIPENISTINASLQDVNIKQYIFNDQIQFRVNVTITTGLTNDQTLKIDQTVHVKGKRI